MFLLYFISLSYGVRTSFTFFFLLLQGKGESLGSMERRKHILTIIIIFTIAEKKGLLILLNENNTDVLIILWSFLISIFVFQQIMR